MDASDIVCMAVPAGGVSALALAIAVPLMAVVGGTAVVLVVLLAGRRRAQHRALLSGAVTAPGPGPATTLVVTAVADWHLLWEEVEGDVIEAAVRMHDRIIRGLAAKHGGYESSSSGEPGGKGSV